MRSTWLMFSACILSMALAFEESTSQAAHGDSLIHNPQSGQESIDLEDVRTSSGSDVFKSGSSYAVDGCVANDTHGERGEAGADSRVILTQNHIFFPEEPVLNAPAISP